MMSTVTTTTVTQQPTSVQVTHDDPPSAENDDVLQGIARGDRQGVLKLRGIPSFSDPNAKRQWIRQHMAAAFSFFGKHGYVEGTSGHISVRDPILPGHFWMNPFAIHFSLIKASDMVLVDGHGYVVEGGNQAMVNKARIMIHSEVHHARAEVMAVAHAHGVYGKTWSGFGKPIDMLTQDICILFGKVSVYDDHEGIALAQDEGRAIANALGKNSMACVLQNHGYGWTYPRS